MNDSLTAVSNMIENTSGGDWETKSTKQFNLSKLVSVKVEPSTFQLAGRHPTTRP